ncbi:hypothetical protein PRABACTJOHN_01522 [Parabacteroides johnsonii DSM 18315]|uniref:Uncharacterized protein n=1 Tax=Parabacteroides johnsonii DSM 18315 TaxID=537006 RepID=B7B919_9BACT|nr:hypothetical protein PRABACTJOHN_01522 [Parabacteroides johnsonii DSM 18315]
MGLYGLNWEGDYWDGIESVSNIGIHGTQITQKSADIINYQQNKSASLCVFCVIRVQ